jgi:hypothetical protein
VIIKVSGPLGPESIAWGLAGGVSDGQALCKRDRETPSAVSTLIPLFTAKNQG